MKEFTFNDQKLLLFENGDVYKKLSGFKDGYSGYIRYVFNKKRIFAHQLIAKAFIRNPENKPCVNHKDGNVTNNAVSNLEWCTHKENSQHSYDVLKRSPSGVAVNPIKGVNHWRATPILQLDMDGNIIKEWLYITEAANRLNIDHTAILNCIRGRSMSCAGYMWEYKNGNKFPKKQRKQKRHSIICETTNKKYKSIYEAAKKNGLTFSAIDKALKYNRPVKGLLFKLIDN